MRKKRVALVGLVLFTKMLEEQIMKYDQNKVVVKSFDTYYNKWDKIKAFFYIPFCSTVYSINGALDKSRTFDWAFFWKKKVMMTWAGTDVTKARKVKNVNKKYLNEAEHYCESPWLQEELKLVGIDAEILYFTNFEHSDNINYPDNSGQLTVLSYISKGREVYYGIERIMKLAKLFPNISFRVAGTDGEGFETPENLVCLGWVKDMKKEFEKAHITMRLIEHDGFPNFVCESMLYRKHVFYTNPMNECVYVKNDDHAAQELAKYQEKFKLNTLAPNQKAREFILENLSQQKVLDRLIKKMID